MSPSPEPPIPPPQGPGTATQVPRGSAPVLPRLTRAQREAMQANIRRLRELHEREHGGGMPPDR